jgi:hypothetical protein
MSKGSTRQTGKLSPRRPSTGGGGGGGGVAAVAGCTARTVTLTSARSLAELKAMGTGDLSARGNAIIVRRGHVVVGSITSDIDELRHCIEDERVPFDADLAHLRVQGSAFEVRVRPGSRR